MKIGKIAYRTGGFCGERVHGEVGCSVLDIFDILVRHINLGVLCT